MTRLLFLLSPVIWGSLVLGIGYLISLDQKWMLRRKRSTNSRVVSGPELNDRTQGLIS